MMLSLGIIIGLLLAILIAILHQRFQHPIQRTMNKISHSESLNPEGRASIVGLSEEESKFLEGMPVDRQVDIL